MVQEDADRNPPRQCFTKPRKLTIYTLIPHTRSQIRGKRTGVQPVYHEKNIKIRQNDFSVILNFDNVGTQFEWIIISIIPVLSKEHGNTYARYNAEQACSLIQKITISNIKDENGCVCSKVYDLNDFDDKYLLYKQYLAYISNRVSTLTMLDF